MSLFLKSGDVHAMFYTASKAMHTQAIRMIDPGRATGTVGVAANPTPSTPGAAAGFAGVDMSSSLLLSGSTPGTVAATPPPAQRMVPLASSPPSTPLGGKRAMSADSLAVDAGATVITDKSHFLPDLAAPLPASMASPGLTNSNVSISLQRRYLNLTVDGKRHRAMRSFLGLDADKYNRRAQLLPRPAMLARAEPWPLPPAGGDGAWVSVACTSPLSIPNCAEAFLRRCEDAPPGQMGGALVELRVVWHKACHVRAIRIAPNGADTAEATVPPSTARVVGMRLRRVGEEEPESLSGAPYTSDLSRGMATVHVYPGVFWSTG